MAYTLEQVVELAKEVELGDSISWEGLNIDRNRVYQIIGSQVYDIYQTWENSDDKELIMLATITKLVIENFVLHVALESHY